MKSFPKFAVLALVTFLASASASAHTIVAHKAKIRLKQVLSDVTGGNFGFILGIDTAQSGWIEFTDKQGRLVARPFPIKIQMGTLGATVMGTIGNNQTMSLFRTNGKQVKDLMGRYTGVRAGAALFSDRISGRNTVMIGPKRTILVDHTWTTGLGLDLSASFFWVSAAAFLEKSDLPGDWDSDILIK